MTKLNKSQLPIIQIQDIDGLNGSLITKADSLVTDGTIGEYVLTIQENPEQPGTYIGSWELKEDLGSGTVKSINTLTPDANGNVALTGADISVNNAESGSQTIAAAIAALTNVGTIRGSVDVYSTGGSSSLTAINTTNLPVNTMYIVEADETASPAGITTIYSWDGTQWNYSGKFTVDITNLSVDVSAKLDKQVGAAASDNKTYALKNNAFVTVNGNRYIITIHGDAAAITDKVVDLSTLMDGKNLNNGYVDVYFNGLGLDEVEDYAIDNTAKTLTFTSEYTFSASDIIVVKYWDSL